MFCSQCGARVAEDGQFCPHCGNPTGASVAVPSSEGIGPHAALPQQIFLPAPVAYAGFWLRFIAYIIDALILGVVAVPLFLLFGGETMLRGMGAGRRPEDFLPEMMGTVVAFEFAIFGAVWLYYALFESSSWQGTPGKKVLGLYVTDRNGQRISFGRATGRYFAKIISSMTFMFGYMMAGFTARKQALHDMIADTLVMRRV